MRTWETDRLQCQVIGKGNKRCVRIGTHAGGGLLRCTAHHNTYLKNKEKQNERKPDTGVPR